MSQSHGNSICVLVFLIVVSGMSPVTNNLDPETSIDEQHTTTEPWKVVHFDADDLWRRVMSYSDEKETLDEKSFQRKKRHPQ